MARLAGRRALVVGASSGIGRATVISAASEGATVAAIARRTELLDETVSEAQRAGGRARAFPGDVSDDGSCRQAVDQALSWLGGLDDLVYAAGSTKMGDVDELSIDDWRFVLDTNLLGAVRVLKGCLPSLRERGQGRVALLSSHSVEDPWPGLVAYGASKAALETLGLGLGNEDRAVHVVIVRVGPTLTGFADSWDPDRAATAMDQWSAQGLLRHRVLDAAEVADAVISALCTPDAREVTVIGETES